jgi:hypothetical protein
MGLAIFGESDFNKAQWVSENNNRGTWSLIQTCLITLGLCVYSAVHLNCFQSNCPLWMKYVVRGKWLIVALLAPEFIVFNAWSQRRQAVRLARILRRRSGQEEPKSWMRSLCDWVGIGSAANDEEKCQRSTLTEDSKPIENAVAAVNTKSHSLEIQEVSPEGDKVPRVELRKMRSMSAKVQRSIHPHKAELIFIVYHNPPIRSRTIRPNTRVYDRNGRARSRYVSGRRTSLAILL